MRSLRTMVLIAGTVAAAGCSDVFGPWGTSGHYALRSANGTHVPAVVYSRTGDRPFRVTLTDGELRLRGDHTFRLELSYLEVDGGSETRYTQGISGEWDRDDDAVWLDYLDPESGAWESLVAFRTHDNLELNIPGAVRGTSIRVVFDR